MKFRATGYVSYDIDVDASGLDLDEDGENTDWDELYERADKVANSVAQKKGLDLDLLDLECID